jgi:hypothetical protein
VLLAAGSAVGLSLTAPHANAALGKWASTVATAWVLVTTIGLFLVGGYLAGRLRLTWGEGIPDEVVFRDGAHGLLLWSLSIVLGLALLTLAGNGLAPLNLQSTGAPSAGGAGTAVASSLALTEVVDVMLRHAGAAAGRADWLGDRHRIVNWTGCCLVRGATRRPPSGSQYSRQVWSRPPHTGVRCRVFNRRRP